MIFVASSIVWLMLAVCGFAFCKKEGFDALPESRKNVVMLFVGGPIIWVFAAVIYVAAKAIQGVVHLLTPRDGKC